MEKRTLSLQIKEEALRLGFGGCGMVKASRLAQEECHLDAWLSCQFHAGMAYMAANRDKRIDPTLLMEGARSVVCLLANYKPAQWQPSHVPKIASFAYGDDYHIILKEKLYLLKHFIDQRVKATMRLFTDTAPLLERAWAARAGLGWIGKSGMLISPQFGPFTFISVILIDLELDYDMPVEARCGNCNHCLQACPTGALCAPYRVDAGRCISYHTIENKSSCTTTIDTHGYIFGCDACILACPWGSATPHTLLFPPLPNILHLTAKDWEEMSPDYFHHHFARSALRRAGLSKIQNNVSLWNGKPKLP